ncbi:F-box/FBD/LRR-repeat protein At1g13570-like [Tasmannia lanceolata]|uniref:F-box/FBD/LRR-repeat protein At1g13570-like n=1 Tax=Tasmannia lanceolata TaxID=3420 RepID=UPI004063D60A
MNSSSKRERRLVSDLDLISNLPGYVLDKILVHLPIKDAVRTSILSRNWRHKWVTIPEIVFDMRSRPDNEPDYPTITDLTCAKIVYQFLLQHRGPIHKFECSNYIPPFYDFHSWLLFLSRQGIKEIVLDFSNECEYDLPASLFSCQEMYRLSLYLCNFRIPPGFKGFHCLKILSLLGVGFDNDELDFLISNCPLLESLTFIDYSETRLKINAPNLQYLYVEGLFDVFSFENTPVLASASIQFGPPLHQPVETCSFTKLLSCLRNVKKLVLSNDFLRVFTSGDVPHRVPYTFCHLKELSLDINFDDPKQILAAFCLLRSSHNVQELRIQTPEEVYVPVIDYWEAQDHLDYRFNHLRAVKMSKMQGVVPELEFIELLLVNAPVLKTLTISKSLFSANEEARIFLSH